AGRPGARSTLALAMATVAANVLAYVFTIALSRLLGVRDFGELGTLLAVWLIAQIPAVACQLTAARAVAAGSTPPLPDPAAGPDRTPGGDRTADRVVATATDTPALPGGGPTSDATGWQPLSRAPDRPLWTTRSPVDGPVTAAEPAGALAAGMLRLAIRLGV